MNYTQEPQNQNTQMYSQSQAHMVNRNNQIPTVGNFLVTLLLTSIPIVNLILLIIWAVGGGNTPLWKSNYAKATFILMAISIVVAILFSTLIGSLLASFYNGYY